MSVMDPALAEAFQAATVAQLQEAMDAAGGRDDIDHIWIYMTPTGSGLAAPLYGVAGRVVEAYELDDVLSPPVGSRTAPWQRRLLGEVHGAFVALMDAFRAAGAELPTRIVVHYDADEQRMDTGFSYHRLHAHLVDPVPIFHTWLAHARATGDFSADATTVPED